MTTPRLFVEAALATGQSVRLDADQAGYLGRVLRLGPGAEVKLFNGRDGEWLARLEAADKRGAGLKVGPQTRAQSPPADVWALFAPVKRQQTDWMVEKAVELGAARLVPVLTRRTIVDAVRVERLTGIAREAAEQCERLEVPEVAAPDKLDRVLAGWPADRPLFVALERSENAPRLLDVAPPAAGWGVLTGPEGGFDPAERSWLLSLPFVRPVSLGSLTLRAETALAAMLALSVARFGQAQP
jgi:16S rRNA (uracil1498-N3)-methyltransferase